VRRFRVPVRGANTAFALTCVWTLVLLIASGACSGKGISERSPSTATTLLRGGMPVLDEFVRRPGTPIGDDLIVADGSALVGRAIPNLYSVMHGGEPIEDDGWVAVLAVTQPARTVIDRYVRQAQAAGYPISAPSCSVVERVADCSATSQQGLDYATGFTHGRRLVLEVLQGPRTESRPPVSHLVISYNEIGDAPFPPSVAPSGSPKYDLESAPPADWPPLARPGETLWSPHGFEVPDGSRLLAPPVARDGGNSSLSLFAVSTAPERILEQLVRQAPPSDGVKKEVWTRDDTSIYTWRWTSGGHTVDIRFATKRGETPLLLIESHEGG
jgi:hypothetical protein